MEKIFHQNTITYHPITKVDIGRAIALHKMLIESTGSDIGDIYLKALYEDMITNPNQHTLLGAYDDNTLVGLVSASRSVTSSDSIIVTHARELIPRILSLFFTGNLSLYEIITKQKLHKYMKQHMHSNDIYIHAVLTDPGYQRRGIASSLIRHVQRLMHPKSTYLDTRKTNEGAITFYKKLGFVSIMTVGNALLLKS